MPIDIDGGFAETAPMIGTHVTPGHMPGCTTGATHVEGRDVVFVGRPTVPDNYRIAGNAKYPNEIDGYRRQFVARMEAAFEEVVKKQGGWTKTSSR